MGLMIYNMGSAMLRALGNTKQPLLFLCFSSVVNVILDLFFVIIFDMKIEGVALATVIAQILSVILIICTLQKNKDIGYFSWKYLCLEKRTLKRIVEIGFPTGFQQALTSLSNVFVHGYINGFGAEVMAGWSCYLKLNQFVMLPLQSMGQASTTFVSQNVGAGEYDRVEKGTKVAMKLAIAVTCCIIVVVWWTVPWMVQLFSKELAVVDYGILFVRENVCFTICCCVNQVLAGALRGRGNARVPMLIMLVTQVGIRQIYLMIATSLHNTVQIVGFAFPVGWISCTICMVMYYIKNKKKSLIYR